MAGLARLVGRSGLGQGPVLRNRNETIDFAVVSRDTVQVSLRQFDAGKPLIPQARGQFRK